MLNGQNLDKSLDDGIDRLKGKKYSSHIDDVAGHVVWNQDI